MPTPSALRTATVQRLDGDPENQYRIGVLPAGETDPSKVLWVRLAQFQASNGTGAWFVPEVEDEVIIGDLNGDPAQPVVLGALYSARRKPPHALTPENNTKAFVSRGLCTIEIDDDAKSITITTPGENRVVLNDATKSIELHDENQNSVALGPDGITLSSAKDITIKATGSINVHAAQDIALDASAGLKGNAVNVELDAQATLVAKGNASAELSASGQVTVKGALVMIN